MADTPRSRSSLITLFANNSTGEISEQDLRDFVVSCLGEFAGLTITGGSTNQVINGTPAKMTGWEANGLYEGLTPAFGDNEITVNTDGTFHISLSISFTGTASKIVALAFYKDIGAGYVDASLPAINHMIDAGGNVASVHLNNFISLTNGDKLCVYVWSTDGGVAFTPVEASLMMKRVY